MRSLKGLLLVATLGLAVVPLHAVPGHASSTVGAWSAPFQMGEVAIHATLTRTGDVLFFQYVEGSAATDRTGYTATWNPQTGQTREAPIGYDRDLFCAAQTVLPDGRVFVAGGHDPTTGQKQSSVGAAETDLYDPVTRTWTRGPLLSQKRWYPTDVGLRNGTTLVFGGQATGNQPSNTVDSYDPATGRVQQLPATATMSVGLYPRMHLLPNGLVVKSGPARATKYFNPTTSTWTSGPSMVYGSRQRGSSTLLPGGKVLAVGGAASGTATATAEVLDTAAAAPAWRATGAMRFPRIFPGTVALPDGTVLVVGGGTTFKYGGPVKAAELYDPATGTWSVMASQQGGRVYHGTALLLPDGRVLSAGQDSGSLATSGEIYSPPYLFKGPRPAVSSAPATVTRGQSMTVTTPDAAGIAKVTLVRAGSTTHGIDTEQRAVPLAFTRGSGSLTATVPANGNELPSGYYMLFVVDGNGVPSVAPWVRVG